jgi:hypothetical protein
MPVYPGKSYTTPQQRAHVKTEGCHCADTHRVGLPEYMLSVHCLQLRECVWAFTTPLSPPHTMHARTPPSHGRDACQKNASRFITASFWPLHLVPSSRSADCAMTPPEEQWYVHGGSRHHVHSTLPVYKLVKHHCLGLVANARGQYLQYVLREQSGAHDRIHTC